MVHDLMRFVLQSLSYNKVDKNWNFGMVQYIRICM